MKPFVSLALLGLLAACGADRQAPADAPTAGSAVMEGGFTITSVAQDWPIETQPFPDSPGADLLNANCTACHSASMVLFQPRMPAEKWAGVVAKMREVYKAPIAEEDVPRLVDSLLAQQSPLSSDGG